MAVAGVVEKLAKLLELPVTVIRAYAGRLRVRVAARRVAGPVRPPKRRIENELYEGWRDAPDKEKPELEEKLFAAVRKHADAVIWTKLNEKNPDLSSNIASAVIERLGKFRQEATFGTWVHRIALNEVNMELRNRSSDRQRFVDYKDENLEAEGFRGALTANIDELEQLALLERMKREVSAKDYVLLECKLDDMSDAEVAEKFGISQDAAESRWRRLRLNLRKKFRGSRDGK